MFVDSRTTGRAPSRGRSEGAHLKVNRGWALMLCEKICQENRYDTYITPKYLVNKYREIRNLLERGKPHEQIVFYDTYLLPIFRYSGFENLEDLDQLNKPHPIVPQPKSKVFISYAKEDYQAAKAIYNFLRSENYAAWLDKENILPGQNWDLEIKKGLRDADFIILLLSKTSVSKRGYIQREFRAALDYVNEKLDEDIYIIPFKIDDCVVPASFTKFQYIEYHSNDSFELLLKSMRFATGKKR